MDDLYDFINYLNQSHPTIKFTHEISQSQISFLDVLVCLEQGQICTKVYNKPTDAHLYLHYKSSHPKTMKDSIPYSQLLRIRRICSKQEDFVQQANQMMDHFKNRGYPSNILNEAYEKIILLNRDDLLKPNLKDKKDIIPYVSDFNLAGPKLNQSVQGNRKILKNNYECTELLKSKFLIAHRRPKNLRDMLVKSRLPTQGPINPPKTNCNCITCNHWIKTSTITSKSTGETFPIDTTIHCQSRNIIYMIECQKCGLQYIGESSRTLRERYTEHRSKINKQYDVIIARHFNYPDHSINDVTITGVSKLTNNNTNQRRRREDAWIEKLRCHHPDGLNEQQ